MRGVNSQGMFELFRRYGKRKKTYLQYWGMGIEAGYIDEAIVLEDQKGHVIGLLMSQYNKGCRNERAHKQQILAIRDQDSDGETIHLHQAFENMEVDKQAEAYKEEWRVIPRQIKKVQGLYDVATGEFGEVHAVQFRQLTIGYPRPEWPGLGCDDEDGCPA